KPLPRGTWLNYMLAVAKSAGHAVPDAANAKQDRIALAWSGIYLGLAEKLRVDDTKLSEKGQLRHVEGQMVARLERDSKTLEAKHAPKN
ncbi:MAG: hypothetical protein ABIP39_14175, partial [Polyangiaceae bacterium]